MNTDILIVGAGIAGLACARRLSAAGLSPVVLDKGRGVGGRMATRRVMMGKAAVRFDHGAQYFTARDDGFSDLLRQMGHASAAWEDGANPPHLVGVPGMSSLPRAMADGLDMRLETEVTALRTCPTGWEVEAGAQRIKARLVVLTVPAPQAARLLGEGHALHRPLAGVVMAPCLTLMAAFPAGSPAPFVSRASKTDPLGWIAQDSSKPGRDGELVTWVAQASADWSNANLELAPEEVAQAMLPLLADAIGVLPAAAVHFAAHRWRYAHATRALGVPFLCSDDQTLYLGGDWCLGARVEAAFCSGDSIARELLAACGGR